MTKLFLHWWIPGQKNSNFSFVFFLCYKKFSSSQIIPCVTWYTKNLIKPSMWLLLAINCPTVDCSQVVKPDRQSSNSRLSTIGPSSRFVDCPTFDSWLVHNPSVCTDPSGPSSTVHCRMSNTHTTEHQRLNTRTAECQRLTVKCVNASTSQPEMMEKPAMHATRTTSRNSQ